MSGAGEGPEHTSSTVALVSFALGQVLLENEVSAQHAQFPLLWGGGWGGGNSNILRAGFCWQLFCSFSSRGLRWGIPPSPKQSGNVPAGILNKALGILLAWAHCHLKKFSKTHLALNTTVIVFTRHLLCARVNLNALHVSSFNFHNSSMRQELLPPQFYKWEMGDGQLAQLASSSVEFKSRSILLEPMVLTSILQSHTLCSKPWIRQVQSMPSWSFYVMGKKKELYMWAMNERECKGDGTHRKDSLGGPAGSPICEAAFQNKSRT
jgi:hypothetical protein